MCGKTGVMGPVGDTWQLAGDDTAPVGAGQVVWESGGGALGQKE